MRRRHVRRKLVRYPGLRAMVIDRLRNWSPEQIAGRLKSDGINPFRICTETIYRFAYSQHGGELMLYRYLPEGRRARRRGSRKPRGSYPRELQHSQAPPMRSRNAAIPAIESAI
ncbi:hypothetical protein [Phyllobacterium zundukense]|uniref:Uncharacterized protein n=1 Tax=Phyllobacterium zundukense TaxID=1867719 RepID=A0ACD4CYG0_9HYPH|nr:hypothetical protein [Phyllobacterium zundukense]UXN58562.1 hypothetical protein N8E88_11130 [Phyllobacterium zundukense]